MGLSYELHCRKVLVSSFKAQRTNSNPGYEGSCVLKIPNAVFSGCPALEVCALVSQL